MKSRFEFDRKMLEDYKRLERRVSILETLEPGGGLFSVQRVISTSSSGTSAVASVRSTSQIFVDYIKIVGIVGAPNDGTDNYDIVVRSYADTFLSAASFTNITNSFSTSGWGTTWNDRSPTIIDASPSNYGVFSLNVTKNNNPGTLTMLVNIYYRIAGL